MSAGVHRPRILLTGRQIGSGESEAVQGGIESVTAVEIEQLFRHSEACQVITWPGGINGTIKVLVILDEVTEQLRYGTRVEFIL